MPLERTLPGPSYTSEAEFARERDRVRLVLRGPRRRLAEPGCYLAADVCGESIIVTRADDGGLAGYYNLCRHRGSRLVPTAGCQPAASGRFPGSVRCPYHAWTYALDGTLRAAPFLPALREYRAALSLHRVDVATWGGFVFARLEPLADRLRPGRGLEATVGEIAARTAAYPLVSLRSGAVALRRGRQLEGHPGELQRVLPLRPGPPGTVRS